MRRLGGDHNKASFEAKLGKLAKAKAVHGWRNAAGVSFHTQTVSQIFCRYSYGAGQFVAYQ